MDKFFTHLEAAALLGVSVHKVNYHLLNGNVKVTGYRRGQHATLTWDDLKVLSRHFGRPEPAAEWVTES